MKHERALITCMRGAALRGVAVAAVVVVVVVVPVAGVSGQAAPPTQPTQVEAGRRVYDQEKCATCHQIEKRGNSRHPLDGVASRLTAEQIRRWLTHPAEMEAALPRMPALRMSTMKPRLNAQELAALVAYLQTLK